MWVRDAQALFERAGTAGEDLWVCGRGDADVHHLVGAVGVAHLGGARCPACHNTTEGVEIGLIHERGGTARTAEPDSGERGERGANVAGVQRVAVSRASGAWRWAVWRGPSAKHWMREIMDHVHDFTL